MNGILHDVSFTARSLARRPAFATVAALTLALGIGANTTVFSWVKAILLDPLPGVGEVDRLVVVRGLSPREGPISVSFPDYADLRDRSRTIVGLAAHSAHAVALGRAGQVERGWAELATGNLFTVLGVRPAAGRFFRPEEDVLGNGRPVAVISHALWQRRFGGQPSAVGGTLEVNGQPYTVVGVAPAGFGGGYTALAFDLWVPMAMQPRIVDGESWLDQRGQRWLDTVGRLAPGATPAQAAAELSTIMSHLARTYPDAADADAASVSRLRDDPFGPQGELGPALLALAGLVGMVLLVSCANVANLLLVRTAGRRRELALRQSLGAGRWRLVRLLSTEALLLAAVGAGLALAITRWTSHLLASMITSVDYPIAMNTGLDWRMAAFTAALTLATAVLATLAPTREAVHRDLATEMREASGTVAGSRRFGRWRDAGLLLQVALSTVLLVAAALFIRSLQAARRADPGFNPRGVLLASLDLFPSGIDEARGSQVYDRLLERLRALPGFESATLASDVPFFGGSTSSGIVVPGFEPAPGDRAWTFTHWVGPDYFRTLQVPIEAGREPSQGDTAGQPAVAVVNRTFVERYLGGKDALGHEVQIGDNTVRIVGVARDLKHYSLREPAGPHLYYPLLQRHRPAVTVYLRGGADPTPLAPSVRDLVRELAPGVPVFNVRTLEQVAGRGPLVQRLAAMLLSVLGALVLVIAGVGLYGLLAFAARARLRELGVRLALGASRRQVARTVLGRGLAIVACGLGLGGGLSLAVGVLLSKLLFSVGAFDPVGLGGAILAFGLVAALASIVPALRAMTVHPSEALRYE